MAKTCVMDGQPAVEVCVLHGEYARRGTVRDFCADCIDAGRDNDNFGRCYECADGLHERCIGVPCQCECPPTTLERLDNEIEQAEAVVARMRAQRDTLVRYQPSRKDTR